MDSLSDRTIVNLEVLNAYNIKDKQWCFLLNNTKKHAQMKVVQFSQKSAEWVRNNMPKKEVKQYSGHFTVLCYDNVDIPIGNVDFTTYKNGDILNIEYRTNLKENPKIDILDDLRALMIEKDKIDSRISQIILMLQNS